MWVSICLLVKFALCAFSTCGGQKRGSDALEQDPPVAVGCHVVLVMEPRSPGEQVVLLTTERLSPPMARLFLIFSILYMKSTESTNLKNKWI